MPKRTCTFPGCTNPHHSRGYCTGHNYQRAAGRELSALTRKALTTEQRFLQKVKQVGTCWVWTGRLNSDGYGFFYDSSRKTNVRAHRFAYDFFIGPIPDGHHIDHICFNRACVNPEHLRPLTHKQNLEHRNSARIDSKTGVRGVLWDIQWNAYIAKVGHNGEALKWGPFKTIEEADAFVRAKRAELFTHDDAIY